MQLIKYFFEEPFAPEGFDPAPLDLPAHGSPPSPWPDAFPQRPRYYRGYLTGTDLTTETFGFTALPAVSRFAEVLVAWQRGCTWWGLGRGNQIHPLSAVAAALHLAEPSALRLLVGTQAPVAPDTLAAAGTGTRQTTFPALRALLDAVAVALYPEPAHHGHDWSLFSAYPMQATLSHAFQPLCRPDLRIFAIPFAQARSEERFYFETYDLERYRAYEL